MDFFLLHLIHIHMYIIFILYIYIYFVILSMTERLGKEIYISTLTVSNDMHNKYHGV